MRMSVGLVALVLALLSAAAAGAADDPRPERVTFQSGDGRTSLIGYVYAPTGWAARRAQRAPAIVMMHGRAGAYSERADGVYDATTLSLRHKAWGRLWAQAGYVAVLVDGFGPRGYPQGFPRFSYDQRPEQLSEVTVRPLDAFGALAYLASRPDVDPHRIALQGWSNGASATIATMAMSPPRGTAGFRAALAFYPACGLKGMFEERPFVPNAPTLILHGTADEEVSYKRCAALAEAARAAGGDVAIKIYPGATHSFDSPGRKRQKLDANAEATEDATERAQAFFARHLAR